MLILLKITVSKNSPKNIHKVKTVVFRNIENAVRKVNFNVPYLRMTLNVFSF